MKIRRCIAMTFVVALAVVSGITTPALAQDDVLEPVVGSEEPLGSHDEDRPSSVPSGGHELPKPTGIPDLPFIDTAEPWVVPWDDFVSFRSLYGFDVSQEKYQELQASDPARWLAGVPFDASESAQLQAWESQHAAANAALEDLREKPGYAGSAFGADGLPGTLRIFGTAEFVSGQRDIVDRNSRGTIELSIEEVGFSLAQLRSQQDLVLRSSIPQRAGRVVAEIGINYEANSIEVGLFRAGPSGAQAPLPEVAQDLRAIAPAVGEIREVADLPATQSLCTQERCRPASSGIGLAKLGFTPNCTTGFVLQRIDTANFYLSSAGHCGPLNEQKAMGSTNPQVALGPVAYQYDIDGGIGDFMAIDIVDTIAANDHLIVGNSGAGFPIKGTEHQWELSQNEWYCVVGLNTSGCGQVTAVSTTGCFASIGPFCTFEQHDLVQGNWSGVFGDSGAGAYMKYSYTDALGLLTGSGYYSHIDNVTAMHAMLRLYTGNVPARDWTIPIYVHGLNRNPDTAGLNYWAGHLASSCGVTRARDVHYNIMLSAESLNLTNWWSSSSINAAVVRVYEAGLGRTPGSSEINPWVTHIQQGNSTSARQARFADLVWTVTFSSEFSNRVQYGSQGDRPACVQ
ncbi:MAG: DUF4214 domain-containing protein [bacterium]|nr:DUF4214 domain-containing protein [bacterium]